ncbi:uncharacterized protein LOC142341366 [Convolutriloba macropyga]|uniref:uncharacterized protein LOC142341366 n=1 Tax=Convolutriloba macropyga TaxID=536237 RepID=UPI003F5272B0
MLLLSLCLAFFLLSTLASTTCPEQTDDKNVMPVPPSLHPIPQLRLLEYNVSPIKLTCQIKYCAITQPVTYKWQFESDKYSGDARELLPQERELNSSTELYHFEGSDLYIHSAYKDWNKVTGYYWCEVTNVHGKATSNRCLVERTDVKQRRRQLNQVRVSRGESVHIKMDKPPPKDKQVPYTSVFYALRFPNSVTIILKAIIIITFTLLFPNDL